ncbi:MAG: hypothetical protein ACPG5T_10825 [Endozoicomonas sp.]
MKTPCDICQHNDKDKGICTEWNAYTASLDGYKCVYRPDFIQPVGFDGNDYLSEARKDDRQKARRAKFLRVMEEKGAQSA